MFLLVFLGPVIHALCGAYPEGTVGLAHQTEHVSWEGFVLWDLIMWHPVSYVQTQSILESITITI